MKKLSIALIAIFLLSLLVACGPESNPTPMTPPATPATPTTPESPTTPAVEEPIILKVALQEAATSPPAKPRKAMFEEMEARSNGRLKLDIYFGETLCKGIEQYRSTQAGIADISFVTMGANPGAQDLNTWTILPFMGWPGQRESIPVIQDVFDTFPALQDEFKGVLPAHYGMMPPSQLHMVSKEVLKPEDLAGQRIIMSGKMWLPFMESVGATPLNVMGSDWYTSLERGLADGQLTHFPVIYSFKTLELFNHHTLFGDAGVSMTPSVWIINLDTWNGMPQDLKDLINDCFLEGNEASIASGEQQAAAALKDAAEWKHTIHYCTPEEVQVWQDACAPIFNKWVEDNKDKGPAQEILDTALRLIKEAAAKG